MPVILYHNLWVASKGFGAVNSSEIIPAVREYLRCLSCGGTHWQNRGIGRFALEYICARAILEINFSNFTYR